MSQDHDAPTPLKITIIGLGSVGGLIGARLARQGHDVSALARGETLHAVQRQGLRVLEPGDEPGTEQSYQVPIRALSSTTGLGPQDMVVIAVKGPALREVANAVRPLLGAETTVISAMNGIPWWFFEGERQALAGRCLASVDPDGLIGRAIPARHVLGGVVMWSSSCPMPGVVRLGLGNRITIGEALGGSSPRLHRATRVLAQARFDVVASADIRKDVWFKLWANMTANPISAITGVTYDRLVADPLVMRFAYDCMDEAAAIGKVIGCPMEQSGERLMFEVGQRLGAFKTSMLQDVEAGRQVELDSLLGALRDIGAAVNVETPCIDALFGLSRLHARARGLYPRETESMPRAVQSLSLGAKSNPVSHGSTAASRARARNHEELAT